MFYDTTLLQHTKSEKRVKFTVVSFDFFPFQWFTALLLVYLVA